MCWVNSCVVHLVTRKSQASDIVQTFFVYSNDEFEEKQEKSISKIKQREKKHSCVVEWREALPHNIMKWHQDIDLEMHHQFTHIYSPYAYFFSIHKSIPSQYSIQSDSENTWFIVAYDFHRLGVRCCWCSTFFFNIWNIQQKNAHIALMIISVECFRRSVSKPFMISSSIRHQLQSRCWMKTRCHKRYKRLAYDQLNIVERSFSSTNRYT